MRNKINDLKSVVSVNDFNLKKIDCPHWLESLALSQFARIYSPESGESTLQ